MVNWGKVENRLTEFDVFQKFQLRKMRFLWIFWIIFESCWTDLINENDWNQLKTELQKCYPGADSPCEVVLLTSN